MRIELREVVHKPVEVISQSVIYCNKCGKKQTKKSSDDFCFGAEYQNFRVEFGYGSEFDMELWDFDLCEKCLLEIVKSFKYVPNGFMQDRSITPIEKDHQRTFELWKQCGKWEPFINYTIDELEEWRGIFKDEYIDELIEKQKGGRLEF